MGAGPAGIAAAVGCAGDGRRVLLLDQAFAPGGQIWRHRSASQLPATARDLVAKLNATDVEKRFQTSVVEVDATRRLTLVHDEKVSRVRARSLVLATGARELFLPFPGWTLPWVVGAGGAQALLKEGVSFAGKRVVVAGSGPLLLAVAAALARSGARVSHVLEQARTSSLMSFGVTMLKDPARLVQAAQYAARFGPWRYHMGSWVARATGMTKVDSVTAVIGGKSRRIPCDVLCSGYGLVPSTELARLAGCRIENGTVVSDEMQRTSVANVYCVGETNGIAGVENAVAQGTNAANTITGLAASARLKRELAHGRRSVESLASVFALRSEVLALPDAETIVCRCEDVREKALRAKRYLGWRELKLQTRMGMGACQGRVCGAAMRARFGYGPDEARSPIFPAPIAALMSDEVRRNNREVE